MLRTPLCDLLGIDVPIIGAPFGPWHQVELAAAVCAAGGLGSVGSVPRPAEELREQWEMLRRLTDRPFAINYTGRSFDPEVFDAVLDFRPAVVSCHLADPAGLIVRAHAVGALWMQQVMSIEQARRAIDLGADVIIAQGGEAGGHGGGVATTMLVPQVVDAAGVVPVVAAGGIADGRGLVAALAMGAQGVSMEMLRTPFLEHWAGRADELGCCASELGAEMVAAIMAGNGQEDVPVAGRPWGAAATSFPSARSCAEAWCRHRTHWRVCRPIAPCAAVSPTVRVAGTHDGTDGTPGAMRRQLGALITFVERRNRWR